MSTKEKNRNETLTERQTEEIAGGRTRDSLPARFAVDETSDGLLDGVAGGRTKDSPPGRFAVDETSDDSLGDVAGGRTQDAWPGRFEVDDISDSLLDQIAGGSCGEDEITQNDIRRMAVDDDLG